MSETYYAFEQMGNCRVCGRHEDLRCGSCFSCSPKVSGKRVDGDRHELWETANPQNRWWVKA